MFRFAFSTGTNLIIVIAALAALCAQAAADDRVESRITIRLHIVQPDLVQIERPRGKSIVITTPAGTSRDLEPVVEVSRDNQGFTRQVVLEAI